jgi:hypothetical protein
MNRYVSSLQQFLQRADAQASGLTTGRQADGTFQSMTLPSAVRAFFASRAQER